MRACVQGFISLPTWRQEGIGDGGGLGLCQPQHPFCSANPAWGAVSHIPYAKAQGKMGSLEDLRHILGSSLLWEEPLLGFVPQLWGAQT